MQLANGKRTGKTWEEIFGKEKTQEMKESMSEKLSNNNAWPLLPGAFSVTYAWKPGSLSKRVNLGLPWGEISPRDKPSKFSQSP